MLILGIETSCDETALSLVKATGDIHAPQFEILGEVLHSQVELHREFGGVFPMLAKREHGKNLVPLFLQLFKDVSSAEQPTVSEEKLSKIRSLLAREGELLEHFEKHILSLSKPDIDSIAVTYGPGLEPALWVGISFAKALSILWDIPLIATNHMEGHIVSPLIHSKKKVGFPVLALLISGGHTELVLAENPEEYTVVGETRDDAVGEAFDKVARLLGLSYPGGPEISKLAKGSRDKREKSAFTLPRPMLSSKDFNFSFSGLKTSVLYLLKTLSEVTDEMKEDIAREFEDAVTEVLTTKTFRALEEYGAQTLIVAGGVSANAHLREAFSQGISRYEKVALLIPDITMSTDNAVMIACAGYMRHLQNKLIPFDDIKATGNLRIS